MNTNHRHDMKALVFSFFENRATPLQKMEADKWLQKEENQRTYLQWLEEWENQNREYHPDTEKHLAKFVAFMHEHADRPRSAERGLRTRGNAAFHYWKPAAAAALIIFMGIGGWTFKDYFLFRRYKTSYGEMKTLVLEDGSIVTLNGNSSLKVSRWNFKSHRNVYLKGEANFSVSHSNEGAPFVVKTDNQFDVKVTGTEFSVFARKRGSRVHLTKGKVEIGFLDPTKPRRLIMKPGDVMTLTHDKLLPAVVRVSKEDKAGIVWKKRRIEFNAASLNEIAEMLRDTYGFKVKIADPLLEERKLVGSCAADSAEGLMQALSEMMNIEIVRNGEQLLIKHQALEPDLKSVQTP